MKKIVALTMALSLVALSAFAQPGGREVGQNVPGAGRQFIPDPDPECVVFSKRAATPFGAGATNFDGRSFNNAPTFFVYPDGKIDQAAAEALVASLGIEPILANNYGNVVVITPEGAKYDAAADFDVFVKMFNKSRSGNLKVIGIGAGATFVNQVIAPKAGDHIAGILTVGGKPAKLAKGFTSFGVPAYVAGKGAAKVAPAYVTMNKAVKQGDFYVNPSEELLTVFVDPVDRPIGEVFDAAWKNVFGKNFRYNNYNHTHYEGGQFGQYGAYELEPYTDWEALKIKRIKVEQPVGGGMMGGRPPQGPQGQGGQPQDVPKQLWYEYWPEELLEGAPAQSVPVMVLLHGNANDPRTQAETSGFIQVAGKERFFVVEMEWQGSNSYQAMGLDGIENTLYTLFAKYPQLDPSRVYAEGLSAGSMTASSLGVKKSYVFAAVGGHSGAIFGNRGGGAPFSNNDNIWGDASQKRGAVEMPYCSVFGTKDTTVPYMTPDNWKGNSYLNAWNVYEQMNGMTVNDQMDFSIDPIFGQQLRDRETIHTGKGEDIIIETGQLYKGDVPLIKMVAVVNYGHWNFMPTAQIMWDFYKQVRRDPETKKLIYVGK